MNIAEIFASGGGVLLIIMTIIQITPIKINPWSWIAQKIGKAVNGEIIDKVDKLSTDLQALRNENEEREATTCRSRILLFGDEILHGVHHSKEHFDQILLDIEFYENYCDDHRKFRNNIAVATIERIKQVYKDCMKNNSFL